MYTGILLGVRLVITSGVQVRAGRMKSNEDRVEEVVEA